MNYFNYFTEIEETFVRRRGKHLFLSPLDWAMIEGWQERGIPLHVVLRSIEAVFDVFDKQPPGTRTIKSLFYCREEVEAQHAEWLRARVGASADKEESNNAGAGSFGSEAIRAHIASAIERLGELAGGPLDEDAARARQRLHELSEDLSGGLETIDNTLGDIERMLEHAMLTKWPTAHLKEIESEVAGHLRGYKAEMDTDSYKSTFRLMLLKRLREEAGVPRLGLFYL